MAYINKFLKYTWEPEIQLWVPLLFDVGFWFQERRGCFSEAYYNVPFRQQRCLLSLED